MGSAAPSSPSSDATPEKPAKYAENIVAGSLAPVSAVKVAFDGKSLDKGSATYVDDKIKLGAAALKAKGGLCRLERSRFVRADIRGASFQLAQAKWVDLSHARVEAADFSDADLQGARLHRTVDTGAHWARTELGGVTRTEKDLAAAEDFK